MISLIVRMGGYPLQSIIQVNFLIVQAPSTYNAIFGRSGLNAIRAIVFTYCLKVKFLTVYRNKKICEDQSLAQCCYHVELQRTKAIDSYPIEGLDARDDLTER